MGRTETGLRRRCVALQLACRNSRRETLIRLRATERSQAVGWMRRRANWERMIMNESAQQPPLAGIKVIEVGMAMAGPFCGMMLADYGADVVKIERLGEGDESRR